MTTSPSNPQGISLDYAGDVIALERIRALFVNTRPQQLDHTEAWLVRLIGQKAMMQVQLLEATASQAPTPTPPTLEIVK